MKKVFLFALFFLSGSSLLIAQDTLKANPILYTDLAFSSFTSVNNCLLFSGAFNYQACESLFTLRATGIGHMDIIYFNAGPNIGYVYGEAGLLYGRRWISGGRSISISAGLAAEGQTVAISYRGSSTTQTHTNYVGLPFEAEVLWFKARKRRSRAYYVFPYGKATGFGSSLGLNIIGNVSAHSFVSFGLVFGLGYFKQY
jgi:hypothetical protein